jgi:hypothetical protein
MWQQFASNHSNSFTVVGAFSSAEDAQRAGQTMQQMLKTIAEHMPTVFTTEPNRAEVEFGERYDIPWTHTLDWLEPSDDTAQHAIIYDNFVIVSNLVTTWTGAHPIDKVLQKLGARVMATEEMGSTVLVVEVWCTAPDVNTAEFIYNSIAPYLEALRDETFQFDQPSPWNTFSATAMQDGVSFTPDDAYTGYIDRDEIHLHLYKMCFGYLGYGLPALLSYLRSKGCTEVRYEVTSMHMGDVYGE